MTDAGDDQELVEVDEDLVDEVVREAQAVTLTYQLAGELLRFVVDQVSPLAAQSVKVGGDPHEAIVAPYAVMLHRIAEQLERGDYELHDPLARQDPDEA